MKHISTTAPPLPSLPRCFSPCPEQTCAPISSSRRFIYDNMARRCASWRLLVLVAAIVPTACHRGPLLHVSRQQHVPASGQQLLATASAPRRSVPSTKQVLEIGGLFSACTLLSLLSDTLTKKILQRDRSLTTTVTFFHFAMSALGGIFVVLLPMLLRPPPEDAEVAPDQLPPLRLADTGAVLPLALCQARKMPRPTGHRHRPSAALTTGRPHGRRSAF